MTFGELRTEAEKQLDAEVLARVRRGIELLDKEYGPDWVDKIDMDTFNIAEYEMCVLGQVYADAEPTENQVRRYQDVLYDHEDYDYFPSHGFARGRAIIDGDLLTSQGLDQHGFDVDVTAPDAVSYRDLQEAWTAEINRLQLERAKAAHQ